MKRFGRCFAALLVFGFTAAAGQVTFGQNLLKVGDAAPPITIGKWIKGEPVTSFEPGKIYVLDFWTTANPDCGRTIPMISELQKKYAKDGVIFIGQNAWESQESLIIPYVNEMGDKMSYRVATDTEASTDGAMGVAWLTASQHLTLPCDFIVDKAGKIAWIGEPRKLAPILEKLVAGTLDPQKEAAAQAVRDDFDANLRQSLANDAPFVTLGLLGDFEKSHPDASDDLCETKFFLLLKAGQFAAASKAGAQAIKLHNDDGYELHKIAWAIVGDEKLAKRDADLALQAANRASELSGGKEAADIDTIARCYFYKHDVKKALEVEKKAIALSRGIATDDYKETLQWFKNNSSDPSNQQTDSDDTK